MLRYLSKASIRGKRVLLRVDFNVPIVGREVRDEYDILRVLPTIRFLVLRRNVCVLLSHHSDEHQSLAPVASALGKRLGRSVVFVKNPFSPKSRAALRQARPGAIFLVENLRFWPGEKANSRSFARRLAGLGEVFVNEAFGELHRPYASVVGLPRFLPSFAGPLVASEIRMLSRFINRPQRPLLGIFGGAKIKTKIPILRRFSHLADRVLVGGAIANALLRSRGIPVGTSPVDGGTKGIRQMAHSSKIVLPLDVVVSSGRKGRNRAVPVGGVGKSDIIYDIGPMTRRAFARFLRPARSIVWNGPLGLVEVKPYQQGTAMIARTLARQHRAQVLVGGGDTIAFLNRIDLLKKFKHVSTGGGAMLAYLAGEKLPGLEAIKKSKFP